MYGTHNLYLHKNKKNNNFFHLKIIIFKLCTAFKKSLHVCVMEKFYTDLSTPCNTSNLLKVLHFFSVFSIISF